MDAYISAMLRRVLEYDGSLRRDFQSYVAPMVTGGVNWLEIDSLVNLLTVRYHQRIEGVITDSDSLPKYVGAPAHTLRAMGLEPFEHLDERSYYDYGGFNAVTAFDQRVGSRKRARQNAVIGIGLWTNIAELGLIKGTAYYTSHNPESAELISYRLGAGNLDKLQRSRALRAAFEGWKKRVYLLDMIAFSQEEWEKQWVTLVKEGASATDVANVLIRPVVNYSWNINATLGGAGTTLTGQRLCSSVWRHDLNVGYVAYDPNKDTGDAVNNAKDLLDHSRNTWAYDSLHQGLTLGARNEKLEFALCRSYQSSGSSLENELPGSIEWCRIAGCRVLRR